MTKLALKMNLWNIRIGSASVAVGSGVLVVFRDSFPPQVPLWYSRPWGESQLADPRWMWLLVGFAVLTTVTTVAITKFGRKIDTVLLTIMMSTNMVVCLLVVAALLRITFLVV